jgi:isoleucyl-tRNA synthetase
VEFTNEVPFSEETFSGLADAYRQFRNILRILLANIADLPAEDDFGAMTTVDRWMLSRLQEVTAVCREAYRAYDFRRVFQTLNQFATVEISALYVDITKDRLYCDAVGAPRRRATQAVMRRLFEGLCRLLAPVLAFTADEAWQFSGRSRSVHLELFPEVEESRRDARTEESVQQWIRLRGVVAQSIEAARQRKEIGNALEASVRLEVADPGLLEQLQPHLLEMEEFFILSELQLAAGPETKASVTKNSAPRCARCWRHRRTVGLVVAELCDRCAEVVGARATEGVAS